MRLIDADALKANINTAFWSNIEKIIDSAPTIDAVSVVRCRDCKWFATDNLREDYCSLSKGLCWVNDGTFCSYGERREP